MAETLESVRSAAARCTACPLFANATQTVFGEGPVNAGLMLVGEQPGDKEDLAGRPFVGPAGRLLDQCLEKAGIDRLETYVTNAVKHFKWTQSGKKRLHARPSSREIEICRVWLTAEIELVKPKVLLCLGATAARSLLGPAVKVTQVRGRKLPSNLAPTVMATIHPSSLLRMPDADRETAIAHFVEDLRLAGRES
jgi:DNA polymerase